MVRDRVDVGGRIDSGDVRDVVTLRLSPPDERILIGEEVTSAIPVEGVVWAIERDFRCVPVWVHRSVRIVRVEADPAPSVVRLVCRDASLEQDRLGAAVVAHRENDEALVAVGSGELREIDAGDPCRGDVERGGLRPVIARHHPGDGIWSRNRLMHPREGSERLHEAGADSLVPAGAEDVDREARCGGSDVEVDRVAVVDARLRGETRNGVLLGNRCEIIPAGRAGEAVLGLDRILRGRARNSREG